MEKPPETTPAVPPPKPMPEARQARLEREAAALRSNLRKRKDQARAREKPRDEGASP